MFGRFVASTFVVLFVAAPPALAAFSERLNKDCASSDPDVSIPACTQYVKMGGKPSNMATRYGNRCSAYNKKKEFDRAIADCRQALRFDPRKAKAFREIGFALIEKRDYDDAIAAYSEAIKLDPKVAVAYHNRGWALHEKGDYAAAMASYRAGQRLKPDDPDYQKGIDRAEEALGQEQLRQRTAAEDVVRRRAEAERLERERVERLRAEAEAADRRIAEARRLEAVAREAREQEEKRLREALARAELEMAARQAETKRIAELEARLKEEAKRLAAVQPPPAPLVNPTPTEPGEAFIPADERRVALVIGNAAYRHVARLPNPGHDSADVTASLKRLGFSVTTIEDADQDKMRRALRDFGREAQGADLAVVFYAGHGMEMGGENYLIPVDAELKRDTDVEQEAVTLKGVVNSVSNARKLGLVMLDACRDNPFLASMKRSVLTRSVARGLAKVEPAGSVLIAYASKEGTTADDGAGRNSPFTTALLKHLEAPGLEVNFLFRHVRDDVIRATARGQEPHLYGSLSSEQIFFKPRRGAGR